MGAAERVRTKPPLPPGAERRRFERFELLAQVQLRLRDDVAILPIVNISAGGMLLRMEAGDLPGVGVDQQVSVFLDVDLFAEPISLTMDATVVRVLPGQPATVGLMFTSSDPREVQKLAKLLEYAAAS